MTDAEKLKYEVTVVMDAESMAAALRRVARQIAEANPDVNGLVLLGILSRGRPLADRIAAHIQELTGTAPRVGSLGITLYRDDLRAGVVPEKLGGGQTHFDFNVDETTVVLVDDVVSAGRTVRAAMDEVMDYGRPRRIQLACLIDRGLRELPIQPDYCEWTVVTQPQDHVAVRLKETDGEDVVLLQRGVAEAGKEGG
jgi:pyrimidine operon attenuation protein/uracil phosphoribosyltransferase